MLCRDVVLTESRDRCRWMLNNSGIFSVKSLCDAIKINQSGCPFKKLWFIKVPAKIKIFLWLVAKRSILTRDVLKSRGWEGALSVPSVAGRKAYIICPYNVR